MKTRALGALLVLAALIPAAPSRAALADWKGHLAVGYGRLFATDAPSGGISVGGGISYPVTASIRLGPQLDYHLLGSNTLTSGSLTASLDYSMFEFSLRAEWRPEHFWAVRRLSIGPMVAGATAAVSSSSAGLAFEKDEIHETRAGFAASAALLPAHAKVVAVGLELGAHVAFLSAEPWTVATARLVIDY